MAGAEKVAEMAEFDEQFISQHQNTDNDVSKKRDHVHVHTLVYTYMYMYIACTQYQ